MEVDTTDLEKLQKIFAPEKESLLKKLKKPLEKYPLAKDILLLLAGTGVVSLMVMMPGLAITVGALARAQEKYAFRKRLEGLKKRKLVEISSGKNGETEVKITEAGTKLALRYKFAEMKIKKTDRWDHKWRIIIFDIPDKKKYQRDSFRDKLRDLGFYSLNESVLVHAYPCFDEIEFVRQIYQVGGEVTYILADKIEGNNGLKSYFGLG